MSPFVNQSGQENPAHDLVIKLGALANVVKLKKTSHKKSPS
jgi:hypothetical protein